MTASYNEHYKLDDKNDKFHGGIYGQESASGCNCEPNESSPHPYVLDL